MEARDVQLGMRVRGRNGFAYAGLTGTIDGMGQTSFGPAGVVVVTWDRIGGALAVRRIVALDRIEATDD
jgi:hypothetical protein